VSATLAAEVTSSDATLRGFLHGLPGVDQVGAEARAAMLATRSIKAASKERAIDLAISMVDLTTLEGMDTPGKVRALCAKALRPDPTDPTTPHVAAVCVYGDMASVARESVGEALHVAHAERALLFRKARGVALPREALASAERENRQCEGEVAHVRANAGSGVLGTNAAAG
jgi:deoxyribose-phosphate aldolase